MPVFLQFRLWLREGPARERVLAAVSALLALALVTYATLPLDDGADEAVEASASDAVGPSAEGPAASSSPPSAGEPGAGDAGSGVLPTADTGSAGPASGPAASASGGTSAGVGAAAGGCSGLTASAPGITPSQVLVTVSMVSLAGPVGNSAVGIRPDLHEIVEALVADINENGGVACGRKLVVKIYDVNPIDQNDQQSKCLRIVQDKPFLNIDSAGYVRPVARACFVQNKLPLQVSGSATDAELKRSSPYLYGLYASSEKQVRDGILGLAERGFFETPRFKKLGLFLEACNPEVNAQIDAALAKVGIKGEQVSKFTLGCNLVANPSEIAQGALQHKAAGASHVFLASSILNNQNYVRLASQQDFKPVYGVSDYGSTTAAPTADDWDPAFDGAVAISSTRSGDLNSGIKTAESAACDKVLRSKGRPGVETEARDATAVGLCDAFNFFRALIGRAGANPTRESYMAVLGVLGLFKTGAVGDGVFDRPGKVTGGDFRRPLQWQLGCKCYKVLDPNFVRS